MSIGRPLHDWSDINVLKQVNAESIDSFQWSCLILIKYSC
ncbi:hypothetical protein SynA1560_01890 [Synechococcus sp. A15-60]|nr:hypothetical protein SynA1560_01890 [Synechococcus sp. A15-60]